LREIYDRSPAPEFAEWAVGRGIFQQDGDDNIVRGPQWGNPRQFCDSEAEFQELLSRTPALYGLESAGSRPANAVMRRMKMNQAVARAAIHAELCVDDLQKITSFRVLETSARDKETHLNSQEAGTRLSAASRAVLVPEHKQVQIVVSDGLSALAVQHNLPDLFPVLLDGLKSRQVSTGEPIAVRYGRVKLAEQIADVLEPELVVYLLGERPGGDALAARSLSAYLVYRLAGTPLTEAARFSGNPAIRFEYTVISNIYSGGLPPVEAGAMILEKVLQILSQRAAGNRLESLLG
jgi:ethanolamine ammonia-lyase large subunit